ncbi:MAG: hypothetical protein GF393_02375, partial [Armatimonadia bacterium]|nr:hypothetical protein [Armatimonadia bacterium]
YWMNVASATFLGSCSTHQVLEDASGYLCYGVEDAIQYALASGDLCYMERGVARTQAEFIAQASVSNLGLATGFGDSANLVYPGVFQVISRAGWYYRDPHLLWVAYNLLHENCGLRTFQRNIPVDLTIETAVPDQWNGMTLLPVYEQTVTKGEGRKEPVFDPKEPAGDEWFNKIVFREAWDPDAQYLLLDGCGSFHEFEGYPRGPSGHRHDDINTIPCFTDEGRLWLVDHTYGARAIKEHSGLYITRDGTLSWNDRLAKLQDFAEGERLNLSRTTFEQYSGATWERTIFWRVGDHFAVIDRAIAQEPGHYVVRCSFRGLGEHALDADRMRLQQGDRFCHVVSDGLAETALETFDQPSADHWEAFYEHAEPVAKIFQQDKSRVLQPGEALTFASAFAASTDESALDRLTVTPVSDNAVIVDSVAGPAVYGLGELPGGGAEAHAWAITEDGVLLAGATRIGDRRLAEASDVYLDGDGLATDAQGIDAAVLEALRTSALPEARRLAAAYQPPEPTDALADVPVQETADVALGTPVAQMAAGDVDGDGAEEWVAAGAEGVSAFEADGTRLWAFDPGSACTTVDAGDIDGDGTAEVVVGCADFHAYALSGGGEQLWRFECKPGTASLVGPPVPEMVRIADLEGDGPPEIIVGAHFTHCLPPSGEVRWEHYLRFSRGRICGDFNTGEIADIDADGDLEVLALYRDSYHSGAVYGPGGDLEIPNDGSYGVNLPYPNSVIALNLWGHQNQGLHYVVGGNNKLIKYHGTGEFVNTNGGSTGGCYLHLDAWRPAEGFPWLFASTDMGAVVTFRAERERNDQWLVIPQQWAAVIGERITALGVLENGAAARLLVGTNSGAIWLLDAATGEALTRIAPTGSPVAQIRVSAGGTGFQPVAVAVRADGTVSRIR